MELPQATLDALPRPDRSNANNGNAAEDKLNNFEKQQSDRAFKHIKGIIEKRSAGSKGEKDAIIDLKGMHCVPYPSFETISDPDPVDFALQGSCIYIVSPRDTLSLLQFEIPMPQWLWRQFGTQWLGSTGTLLPRFRQDPLHHVQAV